MSIAHGYLKDLLAKLRALRERAGLSESDLEERLILGPGWVRRFESGEIIPTIDMTLAILHQLGSSLDRLVAALPEPEALEVDRAIFAEKKEDDLVVRFKYANYDARYRLPGATLEEFEFVVKKLRDSLARLANANAAQTEAIKRSAVAQSFLEAVKTWPEANPSDLWWFVIYRAFCDPYNHPAEFARLDFFQSWKRTSGWALEEILVQHYQPFLKSNGVNLFIADGPTKQHLLKGIKLSDRVEVDKIDVVLTGETKKGPRFFGVVHVKASFAERRTDDVPLSLVLKNAGLISPLWTMDCKSTPGLQPTNRGELGSADGERSAKRKDIEDEGYFTGCFSYNKNTRPSAPSLPPERRIYVCDFSNPEDEFSKFVLRKWKLFRSA